MNITFLISSLTGGGAERVTANIANYMVAKGNEITILTMTDIKETYKIDKRIRIVPLILQKERKNIIYNYYLRYKKLGNYIQKSKQDCYIVMLPITIILMLLQRNKITAKVIVSERNDPSKYNIIEKFFMQILKGRADAWVFQTEEAARWYQLKKDTYIIPNAINPIFLEKRIETAKEKTIVTVGRLTKQKNTALIIKAFVLLSQEFPDYQLFIYGEGELLSKCERLVADNGIADKVRFCGYVSDIENKIAKASLFVLGSNYEGIPNALIEAMALGVPCISTNCPVGGPRSVIKNNVNGMLVECGDIKGMYQAMKKVLSDNNFALMLSKNAISVRESLNPKVIYNKWELIIKKTVGI